MTFKYPLNYVWTLLFKKPFHSAYQDFRTKQTTVGTFKTTTQSLRRALVSAAVILALAVASVFGGGIYIYTQVAKLTGAQNARADKSDSVIIQKMTPLMLRAQKTIHSFDLDSDND